MKAMIIREFGGPEVMQWEDVPTPTPGAGQVLVEVRAVSVNRVLDMEVRQHGGNYGVALPLVLGNDPCGVVAEGGYGCGGLQAGRPRHRVSLDKVLATVPPAIRGMLNAAPTRRCWEYRLGGDMRNTCACLRLTV